MATIKPAPARAIIDLIKEDDTIKQEETKVTLEASLGFTPDAKSDGRVQVCSEIVKRGGAIGDSTVDERTGATTYDITSAEGKVIGKGFAWKDERGEGHMVQFPQEDA